MTRNHETKALVLHAMPIGEYDKRLVLLTKEYGKITAFAKGAKKASSKFVARTEVFAYGEFSLHMGKHSNAVTHIELIDSFRGLTGDINTLAYGLHILEIAAYISVENEQHVEIMELVLRTLKGIEKRKHSDSFILTVFKLRLLVFLGFMPQLSNCVSCGKEAGLNYFSISEGGTICNHCSGCDGKKLQISYEANQVMQYIVGVPLKQLYRFSVQPKIAYEVESIIAAYFKYHIQKKFNALDLLM